MFSLALVVFGTLSFVVLDALQKRYLPAYYLEPLDLSYGLDPELNLRRLVLRLGFPFLIGIGLSTLAIAVSAEVDPQIISGVAAALGSTMLVYPGFRYPSLRYHSIYGNGNVTIRAALAYVSFILLNGNIGVLGGSLAHTVVPVLWASQLGIVVERWLREQLPGDLLTALFFAAIFAIWRLSVRWMRSR